MVKGYRYMCDNTPEDVAKALAPSFTGTPESSIAASVRSYIEIDAWSSTPVMSEEAFNRLQDIMENAGTLPTRAEYSMAVDNTIALKVSQA